MNYHSTTTRTLLVIVAGATLMAAACYNVEVETTEEEAHEAARSDDLKLDRPKARLDRFSHLPDEPVGFDVERNMEVYDLDGDTFPDITEELFGSDPLNPQSSPSPVAISFPAASCHMYNFEGHCNKADSRPYWCCHDDDA
ncbi:hypothetical protein [Sorangium sp. So ce341]|uniref:hypothetical protein n=1 Tax=Sorangium sp. So ce341 TaxID=3133302 RepID=UPI003F5FFB87